MRDGILMARRGLPSVVLATTAFLLAADSVARGFGMPAIPTIQLPHPMADRPRQELRAVAEDVAPTIYQELKRT